MFLKFYFLERKEEKKTKQQQHECEKYLSVTTQKHPNCQLNPQTFGVQDDAQTCPDQIKIFIYRII